MQPGSRPPRIFFSVGEPSGDLHGANLIRALKRQWPGVHCEGYGGPRMAAAGCDLHFDLCNFAIMGVVQVVLHLPTFLRLLRHANRHFRENRPDALVLIDYPGFNWWMARWARSNCIPVFYFVPPQIWAWARWRVNRMRRYVNHVLCTLPFERDWYLQRGIDAPYMGHPYFDALAQRALDAEFVANYESRNGPIVALLPGSRRAEVRQNFTTQLRAAVQIHRARPDVRFLVAAYKRQHADRMVQEALAVLGQKGAASGDYSTGYHGGWDLPLQICLERTQEILHLAHSAIAVSGSVSLELLYYLTPSITLYRVGSISAMTIRLMRRSPYISLVNLLAGRELFPEFLTTREPSEDVANHVLRWLNDGGEYDRVTGELRELRKCVALPGACEKAAEFVLSQIGRTGDIARASA